MRLVEGRKRPSPPSVYVEQSTPVDAKLWIFFFRDLPSYESFEQGEHTQFPPIYLSAAKLAVKSH